VFRGLLALSVGGSVLGARSRVRLSEQGQLHRRHKLVGIACGAVGLDGTCRLALSDRRRTAWEGGFMKHLRVANGTTETAGAAPASLLCYIFIDWGTCGSVDQCGFDFGNCGTRDVCLVDY